MALHKQLVQEGIRSTATGNCRLNNPLELGALWVSELVFVQASLRDEICRGVGSFHAANFPHTVGPIASGDMRGLVEPSQGANQSLIQDLWLSGDDEQAAGCTAVHLQAGASANCSHVIRGHSRGHGAHPHAEWLLLSEV